MSFFRIWIYRKWFCFVHMNHEVNVCNHNLQSNFLFTGFPTLILYWFRIFPQICTSSAWGKLFEGAWRKNKVKIFPQWLAILDCVSILSLLQSCELLAVGSPRRQLWIWVLRSHWSIAGSPIGRQQLLCPTDCNLSFTSQIPPLSGFGEVFAGLLKVVLFLCSHFVQGQMTWIFHSIRIESRLIRSLFD